MTQAAFYPIEIRRATTAITAGGAIAAGFYPIEIRRATTASGRMDHSR